MTGWRKFGDFYPIEGGSYLVVIGSVALTENSNPDVMMV
jgi:hypothetical protein